MVMGALSPSRITWSVRHSAPQAQKEEYQSGQISQHPRPPEMLCSVSLRLPPRKSLSFMLFRNHHLSFQPLCISLPRTLNREHVCLLLPSSMLPFEFRRACQSLQTSKVVLVVKTSPANSGDMRESGSGPGWGRFPGRGRDSPF